MDNTGYMEKTAINIDILLPEVPDEKDACVQRIIEFMQYKRGIEKVHILPVNGDGKAKLCFHYDPEKISIAEVEHLAKDAGADLTDTYGHLLLEVKGVRHSRHARLLESKVRDWSGVVFASISGTGFIQIEFDKRVISCDEIQKKIESIGLSITQEEDFRLDVKVKDRYCHDHSTESHEHSSHDHSHSHATFLGERTELIFAITSGVMLALGFGLSYINIPFWIPIVLYLVAYLTGGIFTTREAISGISKGRFEIDFLMIVAAIGAAFLGKWAEGALLLFLFSLGHSLEHFALDKAKRSIEALSKLYPKTALLKTENGLKEVQVESLEIGQHIIVRPNSTIGADGVVVEGISSVNQAAITGESMSAEKSPFSGNLKRVRDYSKIDESHRVFAGTINGNQTLEIFIGKIAADSTLSRLIKMVNEAQTQKSNTQNFTDRIERYYVPSVLVLVFALIFAFLVRDESFGDSFYRAMAVLIAASPCALAISTPSAVLSGVARAARGGVLIKGGKPLEELGAVKAMAFDKTGTLTRGKPELTGVYPLDGETEESFLRTVIAVEKLSDHPLAAAIVKAGEERLGEKIEPAKNLQSIIARGIRAEYEGKEVHIGNLALSEERNLVISEDIRKKVSCLEQEGNTTMIAGKNGKLIGIITLMDTARPEAKDALKRIREIGIKQLVMLTGDNQQVATAIGDEIGIAEAWGSLLPEHKVEAIEKLRMKFGKVAMVGDGVNDAPAMAKSDVGIAMGAAGSPLALETADVALLADNLSNLPFAIGLSRKSRTIIRQNLVISIGMVVILIPLTIAGLSIAPAVIGHEGSTMVVVLNALRLLGYKK